MGDDYTRQLGVVEAITAVTRSCPSGAVIAAAEQALEAIRRGGAAVMKEQAFFVLTAMAGWRGEKAAQVHRSLKAYIESPSPEDPSDAQAPGGAKQPKPGDAKPPRGERV